jgi:hypothetical protein
MPATAGAAPSRIGAGHTAAGASAISVPVVAESPAPDAARSAAPTAPASPRPPAAGSPPPPPSGIGATRAGVGGGRPPGEGPPRPSGAAGPPSRSSGAFLWGLGGGVIGGILAALATIYLLPRAGDLDVVRNQVADHGATVEQMGARLEALEGTDANTRERVAALETAAGALPKPDAVAAQMAQAETRLAALEDQIGALGAGGAGAGGGNELRDELSQLSATVSGLQRGGSGRAGSGQIAQLEQRLAQVTRAADQIAALSGQADGLSSQIAAGQERTEQVASDVAALSGQVSLLDERVGTLAGDVGGLQNRIATNEERITAASDQGGRAATLALLAGQVEAAIEQGEAYEAPLESLRALGAEDTAVGEAAAQLAPTATTGVSRSSTWPTRSCRRGRRRRARECSTVRRATSCGWSRSGRSAPMPKATTRRRGSRARRPGSRTAISPARSPSWRGSRARRPRRRRHGSSRRAHASPQRMRCRACARTRPISWRSRADAHGNLARRARMMLEGGR